MRTPPKSLRYAPHPKPTPSLRPVGMPPPSIQDRIRRILVRHTMPACPPRSPPGQTVIIEPNSGFRYHVPNIRFLKARPPVERSSRPLLHSIIPILEQAFMTLDSIPKPCSRAIRTLVHSITSRQQTESCVGSRPLRAWLPCRNARLCTYNKRASWVHP